MPGAYVFPGGRVDPADRVPSGFPEPLAPAPHGADRRTRERLAVFVRTALRECLEETGLLVAAAGEVTNGCRLAPAPAGPAPSHGATPVGEPEPTRGREP